jgi:hypothetical protein
LRLERAVARAADSDRPTWLDDAEFGRRLVRRAVTAQRIEAALAGLASSRLKFGPYTSGPIGLASVAAWGSLGSAAVAPRVDGSFAVTIPATLDFSMRMGAETRVGADVEVDLVMTPRVAAPLLLFIEVAAVRARDVRIDIRGPGVGATVTALLSPVLDEVRGYLASQVNAQLSSAKLRASRTIDIGARIDGRRDSPPPARFEWLDDAEVGAQFLRRAVTAARLSSGFGALVGRELRIGPLTVGPRNLARVTANGVIGRPEIVQREGSDVAFEGVVPLSLDLVVAVGRENRYHADVTIPLVATVRCADPLLIVIDIAPVRPEAIGVETAARGAMARLLGRLGGLDDQLRRQIAKTVNERLADPAVRTIDLGARLDSA